MANTVNNYPWAFLPSSPGVTLGLLLVSRTLDRAAHAQCMLFGCLFSIQSGSGQFSNIPALVSLRFCKEHTGALPREVRVVIGHFLT